jgi:hypothetical protein
MIQAAGWVSLVIRRATNQARSRRRSCCLARFSFLAPDIVSAILEGRQPPTLQTRRLLRIAALPACWSEQRRMLGFR